MTCRTLLALGFALGAASSAVAQDGAPAPKSPEPVVHADPADLLRRLEDLYPKAIQRPELDRSAPKIDEARAAYAKAAAEWDLAVKSLARTGDDYLAALAGAAPDARALYYHGVGKMIASERVSRTEAPAHHAAAADSLQRYLDAAGEEAAFRADAEMYLGRALLMTRRLDDAVTHLARAVDLMQKDGRRDDAGLSAVAAMEALKGARRESELRALVKSIRASEADFGVSTPTVRKLAAAARLCVGAPLPELPAVKDVDGNEISWAPGRPMLVHFFLTGLPTAMPTSFREIETEVRPLFEKYGAKGLRLVGVAMDYAIPKAQADDLRAKWDEWGRKAEFRDGSLESCRTWAAKQGIEWPWTWSGAWTNDKLSLALGGVGVSSPFAVLVDKDGIVRWHGGAPFAGLADEVAKLLP